MIEIRDLIGKPYAPHGRGPDFFDCYGLAIEVCRRFGKRLQDKASKETDVLSNKSLITDMKATIHASKQHLPTAGSVVVLRVVGHPCHIGVCLGDGNFIHAMKDLGVHVDSLSSWKHRIEGFYTWP